MKITLHSTTKVVDLQTPTGSVPARIWEGTTDRGTPVHAFVTRICPSIPIPELKPETEAEFKKDLDECEAPSAGVREIPLRLIL